MTVVLKAELFKETVTPLKSEPLSLCWDGEGQRCSGEGLRDAVPKECGFGAGAQGPSWNTGGVPGQALTRPVLS